MRKVARSSAPSAFAISSSIGWSLSWLTCFTVTSNSAGLPASSLLPYSAGKSTFTSLLVALLQADELILEARDEHAGAELQVEILGLAAIEFLAVDAADEIDLHDVARLRRVIIRRGLRLALTLGQALQALVDLGVRHVDDGALAA